MLPSRVLASSLMAALALIACDGSGTTGSPGGSGVEAWDETRVIPILGKTEGGLLVRYEEWEYGWCAAEDSAGILRQRVDVDTFPSMLDTLRLRLDGSDRLFLREGSSDEGIAGLVFHWGEWLRASRPGSAFEGVWNYNYRDTLEVASGFVPDSTLKRIQAEALSLASRYREAGTANQIEISSSSIVSRYRIGEPATIERIHWDLHFEGHYDLTLERVDARTLRYKGATETVTLTFLDRDRNARRYTSTDPSRIPYTVVSEPRKDSDCPEDPWFDQFLGSHYRSVQAL